MIKRIVGLVMLLGVTLGIIFWTKPQWAKELKIIPPWGVPNDCSKIEAEIQKYDWDHEIALAVAKAESKCNAEARGDEDLIFEENEREYGYSVGVFQVRILPGRENCDTYEVAKNVACAYRIYQKAGNKFTPWSMWKNEAYKKYLWHSLL